MRLPGIDNNKVIPSFPAIINEASYKEGQKPYIERIWQKARMIFGVAVAGRNWLRAR